MQTESPEEEQLSDNSRTRGKVGKKTAAKIVETAYEILRTESYEQLTMQGIAKRLGIRLSNVQYYFNNKNDLIRALLEYNTQSYVNRWNECFSQVEGCAEDRFRAFIKFNFEDILLTNTRHFFIQLWPLLSIADNYSGELLKEMYAVQLEELTERVREMSPTTTKADARVKAEIIAAMIEGLMVTAPACVGTPRHQKKLKEATIKAAFNIAMNGC